ncbi:protein FAR1-RELATED SEQUENCE 5-like protein [Corchorus olitorius]|uniref:Protein FAR1-RELATED SEQUENCE 5-like protein n=1 Tax=Corchorus olitorius TaxID=93759 RepID=A0A1R3G4V6_9ROSI|nr:protein FAR1-RELATED SEQUENCE 5-like protein [Corchorus olitorius]
MVSWQRTPHPVDEIKQYKCKSEIDHELRMLASCECNVLKILSMMATEYRFACEQCTTVLPGLDEFLTLVPCF